MTDAPTQQAPTHQNAVDTVEHAAETPEREQPWAELGLKSDEYDRIRAILGRRPTSAELAMYSVMWSEHCSYKSSKVHLKKFGDLPQETPLGKTLAGIGENAGVIDIGQGYAVTFKVESHNHPSYVEPYQGAATGVGGIVRDILAMGARPVAVMDPLRFGPLTADDTRRVMPGIVAGIGGYGNCLGLPNIGGEVVFDRTYVGNPLVNALCVGVLRHEDLHLAHASGVGNHVVLYGARTGGDGIGGVSVLASETFDSGGPAKRPSVQVGDPFMEKLLIECTLELFSAGVVGGIQDLGGAGLSCATSELASAGDGGMHVELDTVPLRDSTLSPEEILMSESQERMMAVVEPRHLEAFMAICDKWEVEAVVVGEVTDGDHLVIDWHGQRVVDVPPRSVAHDGPTYERPYARPAGQDALQADGAEALPRPMSGDELRDDPAASGRVHPTSPTSRGSPTSTTATSRATPCSRSPRTPASSGLTSRAILGWPSPPTATDASPSSTRTPEPSWRWPRRTATSQSRERLPLAVTDCLNFGSPEDPGVMWQFEQATHGLMDACAVLGIPVTGGNVSFYNQTGDTPILPTPVVGVLGVIDDVRARVTQGFVRDGEHVLLLGETREELSGSTWADVVHDHLGGRPPVVDLAAEQALAALLREAARRGLLSAAHDLSDGGLAMALVEGCLRHDVGVHVELEDPFVDLFSESSARAIVVVAEDRHDELVMLAEEHGVELSSIGRTGGDTFEVAGEFAVPLTELRADWEATLPAVLGPTLG